MRYPHTHPLPEGPAFRPLLTGLAGAKERYCVGGKRDTRASPAPENLLGACGGTGARSDEIATGAASADS